MWGGWRGADHIPEISATEAPCAGPSCNNTVEPLPSGMLPWSKEKPWRQAHYSDHEPWVNLCSDECERKYGERREKGNYG